MSKDKKREILTESVVCFLYHTERYAPLTTPGIEEITRHKSNVNTPCRIFGLNFFVDGAKPAAKSNAGSLACISGESTFGTAPS